MSSPPLTEAEIQRELAGLSGWTGGPAGLARRYRFPDFACAIAFMAASAPEIDRAAHHPEWTNVYDRVDVRLRTHDAGDRVTAKDVALAKLLERIATAHRAS